MNTANTINISQENTSLSRDESDAADSVYYKSAADYYETEKKRKINQKILKEQAKKAKKSASIYLTNEVVPQSPVSVAKVFDITCESTQSFDKSPQTPKECSRPSINYCFKTDKIVSHTALEKICYAFQKQFDKFSQTQLTDLNLEIDHIKDETNLIKFSKFHLNVLSTNDVDLLNSSVKEAIKDNAIIDILKESKIEVTLSVIAYSRSL
jgi:hypothetical protein